MDDADRAQVLTERERETSLQAFSARRRDEEQVRLGAAVFCLDCLELIMSDRLRANPCAVRCLECQIAVERKQQR